MTTERRVVGFDIGIRTLSYAIFKYTPKPELPVDNQPWDTLELEQWGVVDVPRECGSRVRNSKTIPMHKMRSMVVEVLRRRMEAWDGVTDVVVENQMGAHATRMTVIQHVVVTFFQLAVQPHQPHIPITLVSQAAVHKLSCRMDSSGLFRGLPHVFLNSTYKQRKAESIRMCTLILRTCTLQSGDGVSALLGELKKADDLADAFMHGLYYVQQMNKINKRKRRRLKPGPASIQRTTNTNVNAKTKTRTKTKTKTKTKT